jgi:tRNA 2-thiocytidine biosynthesis protein TtcA
MFNALGHVVPSHLLDRNLYPFAALQTTGVADASGDKAFDDEDEACGTPPAASPVIALRLDEPPAPGA